MTLHKCRRVLTLRPAATASLFLQMLRLAPLPILLTMSRTHGLTISDAPMLLERLSTSFRTRIAPVLVSLLVATPLPLITTLRIRLCSVRALLEPPTGLHSEGVRGTFVKAVVLVSAILATDPLKKHLVVAFTLHMPPDTQIPPTQNVKTLLPAHLCLSRTDT